MPRLKYADDGLIPLSRLQRKILDGSLGFAAGVRFVHKYTASIIAIFTRPAPMVRLLRPWPYQVFRKRWRQASGTVGS